MRQAVVWLLALGLAIGIGMVYVQKRDGVAPRTIGADTPLDSRWIELSGPTMGSTYKLKCQLLDSNDLTSARDALSYRVRETLDRAEHLWSRWRSDSELSRFNDQQTCEWFAVDAQTIELCELAKALHDIDPRFDVTVAPLSDLWGFGPQRREPANPSEASIKACLESVGLNKIEWRREPPALRKLDPRVRIDFSAIVAGFVANRLAELCNQEGCENYFIDVTGEIIVHGHNDRGSQWRIGIAQPTQASLDIHSQLELTDCAIATSGNYRHSLAGSAGKLGHIINPITGRPAETDILSATVVHESCAWADSIATLLMTMPSQEAIRLADREGWQLLLLVRDEQGNVQSLTENWETQNLRIQ